MTSLIDRVIIMPSYEGGKEVKREDRFEIDTRATTDVDRRARSFVEIDRINRIVRDRTVQIRSC